MLTFIFLVTPFQACSSSIVPPEYLYENYEELTNLNCTEVGSKECTWKEIVSVDFDCRYGSGKCFCCGAVYTYIEQGDICTRYCHQGDDITPKYGNYPVIILPFNWGDDAKPKSAALSDGSPFPIIPVSANLSKQVYGIEVYEDYEVN